MRAAVRLVTIVFAAVAVLLPGAAVAIPAAAKPSIDWAPCAQDPTADCGTLRVPVDWARPHGAAVDIALARRKATDPARRIGSLVVNPGGPGLSGVDYVIGAPGALSERLRQRFDLVGFDPRGVGRSSPVLCSLALLGQMPSPLFASQADFDARLGFNQRFGDDCRRRTGPVFDHLDSRTVARDLDAIRAAVGDQRLSYYAVSYGTLIGQMYAEMFPRRVRALALDGNMDHSLGVRAWARSQAATAQDSFDEFAGWCARDAGCVLHGRDVRTLFADLLARAGRGEIADPANPAVTVRPSTIVNFTISQFYPPSWDLLADYLHALDAGTAPSARTLDRLRAESPAPVAATADDEPVVNYTFPAVFCQDWALPVRDFADYKGHLDRMAAIAPDLRFATLSVFGLGWCQGWPAPVNNPQHPLRVRGGGELLLVNGVHDPATSYAWATNAASQIGRQATLLTYEGWGHISYGRGPCVDDAVDGYLISLTVPAPGARCPAVPSAQAPVGARQLPPTVRTAGW